MDTLTHLSIIIFQQWKGIDIYSCTFITAFCKSNGSSNYWLEILLLVSRLEHSSFNTLITSIPLHPIKIVGFFANRFTTSHEMCSDVWWRTRIQCFGQVFSCWWTDHNNKQIHLYEFLPACTHACARTRTQLVFPGLQCWIRQPEPCLQWQKAWCKWVCISITEVTTYSETLLSH